MTAGLGMVALGSPDAHRHVLRLLLSHAGQHAQHALAHGRGCVDGVVDREQRGVAGLENVEQRSDLADTLAGEAVQLPDDNDVHRAGSKVIEQTVVSGSAGVAPVARLQVSVDGDDVEALQRTEGPTVGFLVLAAAFLGPVLRQPGVDGCSTWHTSNTRFQGRPE